MTTIATICVIFAALNLILTLWGVGPGDYMYILEILEKWIGRASY
jgi:hypothetical protein